MSLLEEKIKDGSSKLIEIQSQLSNLQELEKDALKTLINSTAQFNNIVKPTVLENLWFIEREENVVFINAIKALEEVLPEFSNIFNEINSTLTDEDDKISLGLFNERLCKFIKRLKYVLDMKVPAEDYKKLNWEDRIRSFHILPENWDGEGASKVTKVRIQSSIKFLEKHRSNQDNLKMVFPSMIGSVGLIYHIEGNKVNLLFLPKNRIEVNIIDQTHTLKLHQQFDEDEIESLNQLLY